MTVHISQYYKDFISQDTTYLINTGKAVRGHKITLKENLRKMTMKSRNSSRTSQNINKTTGGKEDVKFTEYTEKYKAFDTIDNQDDLLRFIIYQRMKESGQTKRAIKLFSQTKSSPKPASGRLYSARTPRASLTRQSNRTSISNKSSLTKSISYEVHNSLNDFSVPECKVEFTTDNLNNRMGEYLNLILLSKQKGDLYIDEQDIREKRFQLSASKEIEGSLHPTGQGQYKTLANNFFRKMKKQRRTKGEIVNRQCSSLQGSEQLVKNLNRTMREREKMESNHQWSARKRANNVLEAKTARSLTAPRSKDHPSFIISPQGVTTPRSAQNYLILY